MIRRTLTWLAVGIALGLALSMWFGPSFIRWWWQTPGQPSAFSCDPMIKSATEWLVRVQLVIGAGTGVVLALLANLLVRRKAPAPAPAATKTS